MNPRIMPCTFAVMAAALVSLPLGANEPAPAEPVEKVQKITFVEDDAQKNMAAKIYTLKHTKAADLAPFITSAVVRYCRESNVSTMASGGRELLIVSTGENMIEYVDKLVEMLDHKAPMDKTGSNITGNGIEYGSYTPKFRGDKSMLEVIVDGGVASSSEDGRVKYDKKRNMFYFKDTPATVADIKAKLAWLDRAIPQARVELSVYAVRESDLKDIGIDYLAWKNGPGLNLFSTGYDALNLRATQEIFNRLLAHGVDLAGNLTYGFGGFYTAPAFDMSFLRLLQQDGKATVSATASLMISNNGREYSVAFAPEYQSITKDSDHITNVGIGSDASITAEILNPVITGKKDGNINFGLNLAHNNVVERNNHGAEICDTATLCTSASLQPGKEVVLATWERVSKVEQTVGVPFLCELPILKYIFGTTTENDEKIYYFVTARASKVNIDENLPAGAVVEFDELAKK
jgi:type II secretory pathway component GspD/PulD (secretin)